MSRTVWSTWNGQEGWARVGIVPPSQLGGATFWSQAARVSAVGSGLHVDSVHTFAGLLTAGPSGARADDGSLPALLVQLPRDLMTTYLGPVSRAAGLGVLDCQWSVGLTRADPADLRRAFGIPEVGAPWPEDARSRAFDWVEALGSLLADPSSYRAHGQQAGQVLRPRVTDALRTALGWSGPEPPGDPVLRRAGALAIAFSRVSSRATIQLVRAAGPQADSMLELACSGSVWPPEFAARAGRLRAALAAESWGNGG